MDRFPVLLRLFISHKDHGFLFQFLPSNLLLLLFVFHSNPLQFTYQEVSSNRLCPWSTFLEKYCGWFNQGLIKREKKKEFKTKPIKMYY